MIDRPEPIVDVGMLQAFVVDEVIDPDANVLHLITVREIMESEGAGKRHK